MTSTRQDFLKIFPDDFDSESSKDRSDPNSLSDADSLFNRISQTGLSKGGAFSPLLNFREPFFALNGPMASPLFEKKGKGDSLFSSRESLFDLEKPNPFFQQGSAFLNVERWTFGDAASSPRNQGNALKVKTPEKDGPEKKGLEKDALGKTELNGEAFIAGEPGIDEPRRFRFDAGESPCQRSKPFLNLWQTPEDFGTDLDDDQPDPTTVPPTIPFVPKTSLKLCSDENTSISANSRFDSCRILPLTSDRVLKQNPNGLIAGAASKDDSLANDGFEPVLSLNSQERSQKETTFFLEAQQESETLMPLGADLLRRTSKELYLWGSSIQNAVSCGHKILGVNGLNSKSGGSSLLLGVTGELMTRGLTVLLMDGNFENPSLARMLDHEVDVGWEQAILYGRPLDSQLIRTAIGPSFQSGTTQSEKEDFVRTEFVEAENDGTENVEATKSKRSEKAERLEKAEKSNAFASSKLFAQRENFEGAKKVFGTEKSVKSGIFSQNAYFYLLPLAPKTLLKAIKCSFYSDLADKIREIAEQFDLVLIDSGSASISIEEKVAEMVRFGQDGYYLIQDSRKQNRDIVKKMIRESRQHSIECLGIVDNYVLS